MSTHMEWTTTCDVCSKKVKESIENLKEDGWTVYKYREERRAGSYSSIYVSDYNKRKLVVCPKCDSVKAPKREIKFEMIVCDKCNSTGEEKGDKKEKVHKGFRALLNRIKGGKQ